MKENMYKIGTLVNTGGCAGKIVRIDDKITVRGAYYYTVVDREEWECEVAKDVFDEKFKDADPNELIWAEELEWKFVPITGPVEER